jgi:hypothetical protein
MIKPQDRKKVLQAIKDIQDPIQRRLVALKIAYSEATDSVRRDWLRNQIILMYERFGKPREPIQIEEVTGYVPQDASVGYTRGTMKQTKARSMVKKKEDYWIPDSVNKHKAGSLHRMLEIPKSEPIPFTLLEKIRVTPIGKTIKNPVKLGKDKLKVTKLAKGRSVWGLNLKRITQKKKKGGK